MNRRNLTSLSAMKILNRLFGGESHQRLSILIYHRVLEHKDYFRPGDPTAEEFDWHIDLICKHFETLSLSEALSLMDAGRLPPRALCVTFDDGYADNAELAYPILRGRNVPMTIFVATAFLDGGRMWNDTLIETIKTCGTTHLDCSRIGLGTVAIGDRENRRQTSNTLLQKLKYLDPEKRLKAVESIVENEERLPNNLMLTTAQLKRLYREGVEIGSHTHSHPILSSLDKEQARAEIVRGQRILEEKLGGPARFFAYPNGKPGKDFDSDHRELVHELGFEAAFATHWGVSDKQTDRWTMPRFTPWDETRFRFLLRMLWNRRNVVV